jgi:hypothetical protein
MEKAQGFWSKWAGILKGYLSSETLKKTAPLLLAKIGVKASGFYVWATTVALKKILNWGYPYVIKLGKIWDRARIDRKNLKELEKNETNGATSDEKVQDELNLLNGNKS